MTTSPESLNEAFERWCSKQSAKCLWSFLDDRGEVVESITYGQLDQQTRDLAAALINGKPPLRQGDPVLLVYPPSLAFIIAFVTCLRAGFVAVPVYPPDPRRLSKDISAFATTAVCCGAKVALTSTKYDHVKKAVAIKAKFTGGKDQWPELAWVVTDQLSAKKKNKASSVADAPAVISRPLSNELAFLQFTSGSTSSPKGVQISHGNLAHNLSLIIDQLSAVEDTVVVSWLPQYHDMGLIGSYLGTLYCGGSGFYMSPLSFIRHPPVWVEAISKHRGTHIQAPNFSYALTARKWQALRTKPALDLSCVRHMINGAEPIDSKSMDAFVAAFGPLGLPDGVIFPTYGLAEHTVFVCSGGKLRLRVNKEALELRKEVVELAEGADLSASKEVIGCGAPSAKHGLELVIVDPESASLLGEDRVGEIWVSSPSKANGYWGMPEESEAAFSAKLKDSEGTSGGFLRTGDEGFLHKGEVFVCGRIKDLIIIGGRNYYPQDIEKAAEGAQPAEIRPGCSAAFSIAREGGEVLVLACEAKENALATEALAMAVATAVQAQQGVSVTHMLLLPPKTNRKTTSGKIARQWCKRAFEADELEALVTIGTLDSEETPELAVATQGMAEPNAGQGQEAPVNAALLSDAELEDRLKGSLSALARGTEIVPEKPLYEMGLDSMTMGQFSGMLQQDYGVVLSLEQLYSEDVSVKSLVASVRALAGGSTQAITAPQPQAVDRYQAGPCEEYLTKSCPCCLCLLGCCPCR
ncbi:unnamed protein product [Chrysoparadoxa australica]